MKPFALLCILITLWASPSFASDDNAEMTAIFAADQDIRKQFTPDKIKDPAFIKTMIEGDTTRRERTAELLDAGELTTGTDLYHAAFVFQHGGTAESYLLAHALATAAIAEGHEGAPWIAAATLDRYLIHIGQSQIYGTQTRSSDELGVTMEPYDKDLVSDSLREMMGVPDQATQLDRLEARKTAR
jgi:hypothetical protein